MKVSGFFFALTIIGCADRVYGQRNENVNRLRAQGNHALKLSTTTEEGENTRKLGTGNDEVLTKRKQRKKEIAMAAEELTVEGDEVDSVVVDESEIDSMGMHEDPPVSPAPKHHHRGHKDKEPPLAPLQSEPLPVEAKGKGHHNREKGGKPGHGMAGGHTKELAPKGPKLR